LRYTEEIEIVQSSYYKKLFALAKSTPNAPLRLEIGILKLSSKVFKLTWGYIVKILEMNDARLPKICLLRLIYLHRFTDSCTQYNWVSQFNVFLEKINMTHLLETTIPESWKEVEELAFERFNRYLKFTDVLACSRLTHMNLVVPRSLECGTASYILSENNHCLTKLIIQLRLSTKYNVRFCFKGSIYKINQNNQCTTCSMSKLETLEHIVTECPTYYALRTHYLSELLYIANILNTNPMYILNLTDQYSLKMIYYFIVNCLKLRASLGFE